MATIYDNTNMYGEINYGFDQHDGEPCAEILLPKGFHLAQDKCGETFAYKEKEFEWAITKEQQEAAALGFGPFAPGREDGRWFLFPVGFPQNRIWVEGAEV